LGTLPGEGPCLARLEGRPVIGLRRGEVLRVEAAMAPEERDSGLAECPDFPRFVARALRALGGRPRLEEGARTGAWAAFTCPLGRERLVATGGEGRRIAYPVLAGRGELLTAPGPFDLGEGTAFALAGGGPPLAAPPGEEKGLPRPPDREGDSPLPGALLFLALLLTTLEWWAYHRGRAA